MWVCVLLQCVQQISCYDIKRAVRLFTLSNALDLNSFPLFYHIPVHQVDVIIN